MKKFRNKLNPLKLNPLRCLLIFVLAFFMCGCSSKFERTQLVEGIYYPNGTVKLEGRTHESLDKNYILTISQPLYVTELGKIKIHDFWGSERRGGYEKIEDHLSGVLSYEAARTKVQGLGEYYIPVVMLNQTGRFEYHERTPNFIEWIQDNSLLTFFIFLIILVVVIIWASRKIAHRQQKQREADEQKLQKIREEKEAKEYYQKLNSILAKSNEIVNQILPYYESSAIKSIERAKYEFSENAFSPFWSEIEQASKFLAYYKEALTQLCMNSELYNHIILENKKYNFRLPFPFPFATNISLSQILLENYSQTIRRAQKEPTFSIIWEQRRNSEILVAGFGTLENAINNMSTQINSAIYDLSSSISSGLDSIKYIQKEQLRSFESSTSYLQATLTSMDNKLYYIQWKQKPSGTFFPR